MAPVSFERSLKTTILMISPPPDFGSSWRGAFKSCCGRRCLIRHCRRVGRKRGKRKSTATMAIGEVLEQLLCWPKMDLPHKQQPSLPMRMTLLVLIKDWHVSMICSSTSSFLMPVSCWPLI
ncbi:uncharacterized protein LOC109947216 isoform X2 [Prunus persica]|uniref:uncharacterized protein LOC109947216 isoform X2 n=1 Tax=Prunus persica TaxID=3760 RepID=UPI0009AB802C|nr:uncharacterized protein LOC109947216 isoform X2 [Prunus persica]